MENIPYMIKNCMTKLRVTQHSRLIKSAKVTYYKKNISNFAHKIRFNSTLYKRYTKVIKSKNKEIAKDIPGEEK